jgi:hypothetical protein
MALFPVGALAETAVVCLEQEVIREQVEGQPALKGQQRVCFDDRRIRNEMVWGNLRTVAIFDLTADRVQLIPGADPEYVELSLPDYRRLVALRLRGIGLNDETDPPRLRPSGETRQISGFACRKLEYEQAGRLPVRAELWVTRDSQVDFGAWLRLMSTMGLLEPLGRLGTLADQIDGLPVEVRADQMVAGQRLVTTTRLLRITQEAAGDALFELPAGLTRIDAGPLPPLQDAPPAAEGGGHSDPQGG